MKTPPPTQLNAGVFYEEFKLALKYLGLEWRDMDKAKVFIIENYFVVWYDGREARIVIPNEKHKELP